MRVLSVVQFYFPFQDRGGPVVKVRSLARGLAKRGHQVTVLTADLGLTGVDGFAAEIERCRWGWRREDDGVEAIYLPTRGHYHATTLNPGVVRYCAASLRDFDVVHVYGLYDLLGPAAAYFCRRQGVPYVIEPMGMYRPIDRSLRLKRLWHRVIGKELMGGATRVVATSDIERGELLEGGIPASKVVVRYNGIDLDSCTSPPPRGTFRSKWKIPADQPLILFLSRLIPRKGADILIQAFAWACPESGRLVIAGPEGEAGYRAYLEKCAKESGVESRVLFTGPLYDDDKKAALADADVFALPSRYENFGNAVAEAVASGVPVIVTNACGIQSLIDRRAGLVIASNTQELADALRQLIYDRDLYKRLKAGCGAVVEELGWDRLTEQMEGYYADALASGRNG
ncbi:MAG TPA: glycosyltransferase [Candidatus Acidoferrales bacterium]|nr:glycosyltransferase [Candidatus Acidoferrales bacterium]